MDPRYSHLFAECLAMEQSLPDLTTWVCRDWNSNTQPTTCEVNALSDCATEAVSASYEAQRNVIYIKAEFHLSGSKITLQVSLFTQVLNFRHFCCINVIRLAIHFVYEYDSLQRT